ncbi:MarR family transcriptional regulator [Dysgonomonas sp. 521]|uniref:MarR family winged helix-turn-helix transcriptional regulator n=1 Tax=Dysgonomonas sp. 521 TaxID=2302932 RepID=UPI0013D30A35|nr:MarR family transcriptional regulator [Dysgonomonas sp. 521]NDV94602.1 MarR family transcriptional regulator [Dysgonomonas sp. 521]
MNITNLSTSLRTAVSTLNKRLRKQDYSTDSYSITEIETLSYLLRNGNLLPSELAGLTKVKPQSMSSILDKFEKQKYIRRIPSKEDKRKTYISLTNTGKKVVERTRYERDNWLTKNIDKNLTDKEKKTLKKAIEILNRLAEAD